MSSNSTISSQRRRREESPYRHSGQTSRSYSSRKRSSRHQTDSSSRSRSSSIVDSHVRYSRSNSYRRKNSRSRSRSQSRHHRTTHYGSRSPNRYRLLESHESSDRRRKSKERHRSGEHRRLQENRHSREKRHSKERRRSAERRRSKEQNRPNRNHSIEQCNSLIGEELFIQVQTPSPPKLDCALSYSTHFALNENTNEINISDESVNNMDENYECRVSIEGKNDDASTTTYYADIGDGIDPIDKERIHREIEEKLRQTLAKEGKIYPPPKPEASHPVFANDGSFLEMFKKMQQAQSQTQPKVSTSIGVTDRVPVPSTPTYAGIIPKQQVQLPPPLVGRRRGGKILKTGLVAKQKAQTNSADPKDFWTLYLAEVNKYKNNACESDGGTRPLVK